MAKLTNPSPPREYIIRYPCGRHLLMFGVFRGIRMRKDNPEIAVGPALWIIGDHILEGEPRLTTGSEVVFDPCVMIGDAEKIASVVKRNLPSREAWVYQPHLSLDILPTSSRLWLQRHSHWPATSCAPPFNQRVLKESPSYN